MSQLITRNSIFDNFFDDMAPSFLMRPLHGDALPSANQIKIDVNEKDNKFYVNAEIPSPPPKPLVMLDVTVTPVQTVSRRKTLITPPAMMVMPSKWV